MSNLGGYQFLTTWAKKVGGPKNLVLLIMGGGAIIGTTAVEGGKFAIKKAKKIIVHRQIKAEGITSSTEGNTLYTVKRCGKSNQGLVFNVGDQIRVLESDRDAILIELIGYDNNPYFVDADLLREISDYE